MKTDFKCQVCDELLCSVLTDNDKLPVPSLTRAVYKLGDKQLVPPIDRGINIKKMEAIDASGVSALLCSKGHETFIEKADLGL